MNANELADYLLNFIMTVEDYDESKHERAATMLRQQQAEILAGKIMIKGYSKTIDEQQAEIEILETKLDEAEQRYWNNK